MFANGIRLHVIEAASSPEAESLDDITAIDDLVEAILRTTNQLTVAAICGNAAAGGLMMALAADEVWVRAGAVLNPHYAHGAAWLRVLDPLSPPGALASTSRSGSAGRQGAALHRGGVPG